MDIALLTGWFAAALFYILIVYKDGVLSLPIRMTFLFPIGLVSTAVAFLPLAILEVIVLKGMTEIGSVVPGANALLSFTHDEQDTLKLISDYTPFELLFAVMLALIGIASFQVGMKLVRSFYRLPRKILMPVFGITAAILITGMFGVFAEYSLARIIIESYFYDDFDLSWIIVTAILSGLYGMLCLHIFLKDNPIVHKFLD